MNLTRLQQKLFAVARANPPSESVPFAFEKRIIAQISALRLPDYGALWARGLWRAVAPCTAVMLLLSAWSFFATPASSPVNDFSQDLENTVLAAAAEQDQTPD